jgi:serine O-acetyltransferase
MTSNDFQRGQAATFRSLVFSDFRRYRPTTRPNWFRVLVLLPVQPGLVGSLVLRAQQRLFSGGHAHAAWGLRTLGNFMVGADFVPGADVGPGLMLSHPVGVVLGPGSKIGRDATLASGVVLGVRGPDERIASDQPSSFPTVGDGVFLGAHAAVLGAVQVGDRAIVGANSVVTSNVAADTAVAGIPAKTITTFQNAPSTEVREAANSRPT